MRYEQNACAMYRWIKIAKNVKSHLVRYTKIQFKSTLCASKNNQKQNYFFFISRRTIESSILKNLSNNNTKLLKDDIKQNKYIISREIESEKRFSFHSIHFSFSFFLSWNSRWKPKYEKKTLSRRLIDLECEYS